jgi:phage baseplate assembly protein gpV
MNDVVAILRAIVREELARRRAPELGVVSQLWAKSSDDNDGNHQVNVKLRASGVELQRVPVLVGRLGFSALPNVDDLVLVDYIDGDLNAPVVIGCLYDEQTHPPKADEREVVYQPPDDQDSSVRRLHVELPSGNVLTLDDDKLTLTFGDTSVVVNRDGDVEISAKGNLKLSAQGDISVEAQGDLKLSAQGTLSAKGMSTSLEGQSDATVKGPQVTLSGITQFSPS